MMLRSVSEAKQNGDGQMEIQCGPKFTRLVMFENKPCKLIFIMPEYIFQYMNHNKIEIEVFAQCTQRSQLQDDRDHHRVQGPRCRK